VAGSGRGVGAGPAAAARALGAGQVGHWEDDWSREPGAGSRSAIDTLVERRTRYLILVHVPTGRPTAEAMREGITGALGQLPAPLRRTLT